MFNTNVKSIIQPEMKKTLFLATTTLFITVTFAQQQERIIRFHSDIKIETDGRIEVAEHIRVYAGGNEIRRGIIRELLLLPRV